MIAERPAENERRVITVDDRSFPDRQGWREITATGEGDVVVSGDVPQVSASSRLTAYPPDQLDDPPDRRQARLVVHPGRSGGAADRSDTQTTADGFAVWGLTERLNTLVSDRLAGDRLAVVAVLAAFVLGVLHALAPGHGKTVVAAYLIG